MIHDTYIHSNWQLVAPTWGPNSTLFYAVLVQLEMKTGLRRKIGKILNYNHENKVITQLIEYRTHCLLTLSSEQ